jgi:hypothetical protein
MHGNFVVKVPRGNNDCKYLNWIQLAWVRVFVNVVMNVQGT